MKGVLTALITPMNASGEVDFDAFRRILADQVAAGVAGVVPCGTTGESPTLSKEEKKKLVEAALEAVHGTAVRVVAGTGGNDTRETVDFSRWASKAGAHAVLVVTPYYNKPSQSGLLAHYRAVADAVDCIVIPYNVPGRTGVSLAAGTVAELALHPRIRAIKEATGNVAFASEILDALAQKGATLDILSGDDATWLPLLSVGASGVISVASNLFPRALVALQRAFDAGKPDEARAIHLKYYPLFRDLFVESNPGPIKHAMALAGWCGPVLRPPLAPLSKSSAEILEASLRRCGIAKGTRA